MSDDEGGLCPWPCWSPWRPRPVNDERNSGWFCPWPRSGARVCGNGPADWPDDDELDAAQVRHAATRDVNAGLWLLQRLFSHTIAGSPASEPLRGYAEKLDAALSNAHNDDDRLAALNLASHNPPNNPPRSDDENLRRQAGTAAAVILLENAGLPDGEALEQLAALSGIKKRTLQRYLKAFGKEGYAAFKLRDRAELRALANRCYEPELTELDRQRSVVAAVMLAARHTGKAEKEAFALLREQIKAPFAFRKTDAVARIAARAQRNAEAAETDACADEIAAIAGQIVALNREAIADESRLCKLDRTLRDALRQTGDEALRNTADLYYAAPLAAILRQKSQ